MINEKAISDDKGLKQIMFDSGSFKTTDCRNKCIIALNDDIEPAQFELTMDDVGNITKLELVKLTSPYLTIEFKGVSGNRFMLFHKFAFIFSDDIENDETFVISTSTNNKKFLTLTDVNMDRVHLFDYDAKNDYLAIRYKYPAIMMYYNKLIVSSDKGISSVVIGLNDIMIISDGGNKQDLIGCGVDEPKGSMLINKDTLNITYVDGYGLHYTSKAKSCVMLFKGKNENRKLNASTLDGNVIMNIDFPASELNDNLISVLNYLGSI